VTVIERGTFFQCRDIREIDLNNVVTIRDGGTSSEAAFLQNRNLTKVTGANVRNVGAFAFYGCENIREVYLPEAVYVGSRAFYPDTLTSPGTTTNQRGFAVSNYKDSFPNLQVGNIGINAFSMVVRHETRVGDKDGDLLAWANLYTFAGQFVTGDMFNQSFTNMVYNGDFTSGTAEFLPDGSASPTVYKFYNEAAHSMVYYHPNGADGGEVPVNTKKHYLNDIFVVMGKGSLQKSGHSFAGWNSEEDGTGVAYTVNQTIKVTDPGEDYNLYAQWQPRLVSHRTQIGIIVNYDLEKQRPGTPIDMDLLTVHGVYTIHYDNGESEIDMEMDLIPNSEIQLSHYTVGHDEVNEIIVTHTGSGFTGSFSVSLISIVNSQFDHIVAEYSGEPLTIGTKIDKDLISVTPVYLVAWEDNVETHEAGEVLDSGEIEAHPDHVIDVGENDVLILYTHGSQNYYAYITIIGLEAGNGSPDDPKDPIDPDDPDDPDDTDEPGNPDDPTEPENPDEPNEHENPDGPGEPGEPQEPENPDEPKEPENPDNPGNPSNPGGNGGSGNNGNNSNNNNSNNSNNNNSSDNANNNTNTTPPVTNITINNAPDPSQTNHPNQQGQLNPPSVNQHPAQPEIIINTGTNPVTNTPNNSNQSSNCCNCHHVCTGIPQSQGGDYVDLLILVDLTRDTEVTEVTQDAQDTQDIQDTLYMSAEELLLLGYTDGLPDGMYDNDGEIEIILSDDQVMVPDETTAISGDDYEHDLSVTTDGDNPLDTVTENEGNKLTFKDIIAKKDTPTIQNLSINTLLIIAIISVSVLIILWQVITARKKKGKK
jgi:uncharacterized repeat protein (TIGR02543 family)